MDRYVDLSDTSAYDPAHDGSINNHWNLNDIYQDQEDNDGDIIHIKGTAVLIDNPVKFRKAAEFKLWGNEKWVMTFDNNSFVNFFSNNSIVRNLMLKTDKIISNSDFRVVYDSCLFYSEDIIEVEYYYTGTDTTPTQFNNCTFISKEIALNGSPLISNNSFVFNKCFMYGYDTTKPIITSSQSTSVSGLNNTFFCNGKHNFAGSSVTINGNVYYGGGVNFVDTSDGSAINGTTVLKAGTTNIVSCDIDFNGIFYNAGLLEFHWGVNVNITGKMGSGPNSDIVSSFGSVNLTLNNGLYTSGDLTWKTGWDDGYYINVNNTSLVFDPNKNDVSYYTPKMINVGAIVPTNGLDVIEELGLGNIDFAEPIFNDNLLTTNEYLWSAVKDELNAGESEFNIITADTMNNLWDKANTDGNLWNGYAVVRVDAIAYFSYKSSSLFTKKVIIINDNNINTIPGAGYPAGYYNCSNDSVSVILNNDGADLTLGGPSNTDKFIGYVYNKGNLKLGDGQVSFHHFYGAVHDISLSDTNWYSVVPSTIYFDSNVILDLTSIGLIERVGLPGSHSNVEISMIECKVNNSNYNFPGQNIIIHDDSYDTWNSTTAINLPVSFVDYSVKESINFVTYNGGDLVGNTNTQGVGFWNSIKTDLKSVGAWYYGYASTAKNVFVDLDSDTDGNGSLLTPFTYDQMIEYVYTSGYVNGKRLADGDTINIKGTKVISDLQDQFKVKIGVNFNILFKAWDQSINGPWVLEYRIFDSSGSDFITVDSSNFGASIVIKDVVFISTAFSTNSVTCVKSNSTSSLIDVRNTMFTIEKATSTSLSTNMSEAVFKCITLSSTSNNILLSNNTIGSSDVDIYDSIIDSIVDTKSISNGNTIVSNSEFSKGAPSNTTLINCDINNGDIRSIIPVHVTSQNFSIIEYTYKKYNIHNLGSGSSFWITNNINYGMHDNERYGIGYMYFPSNTGANYYVDLNKTSSGNGTERDMYTFQQLRDFFLGNSSIPYDNEYTFNIKGRVSIMDTDNFISIGDSFINGDVINLKPYGVMTNSLWGVGFEGHHLNPVFIKHSSSGSLSGVTLNISSTIVTCSSNKDTLAITSSDCNMNITSSIISSKSNELDLNDKNYYGCTLMCDIITSGNSDIYDTVIKSTKVQ